VHDKESRFLLRREMSGRSREEKESDMLIAVERRFLIS